MRLDASIRSIDAEMTDKGFDVGALLQLQAQRDEVSSKIEAFIAERAGSTAMGAVRRRT